ALTVQVNDADPAPPRPSAAVTVALYVPGLAGHPVITPAGVIERPAGRPVALSVGAKPAFWSGPDVVTLSETGVPAVDERFAVDRATVPCTLRVASTEEGITVAGVAAVLVGVTVTECIPTGVDDDQ